MKNKRKKLSFILAFLIGISAILPQSPAPAHAASSSEIRWQINQLKKERKEIQDKIKDVQEQQAETKDEIAIIIGKKNIIDQELQLLSDQIENIHAQIFAYNTLIADTQDELDIANKKYEELRKQSKLRVRAMEEGGKVSYWNIIFKANSFSDLLDQINMIEEIAASDEKMLKKLDEAAKLVEDTRKALISEKKEYEDIRCQLENAESEQSKKREEADAIIQELLSKVNDLEALEEEFERQEQDFLTQIAAKEDDFNEAKRKEWLAYMETYVPPATEAPKQDKVTNNSGNSGSNAGSSGGWFKPCNYTSVTSPFGNRKSPTTGASTYHQGVDLDINTGDPIYAARSGVVAFAGWGNAAGNWIKINHMDGFSSVYMHLSAIKVSNGQIVNQGQLIGLGGSTGVSTGSHLHFGIMLNGVYVNPANYILL